MSHSHIDKLATPAIDTTRWLLDRLEPSIPDQLELPCGGTAPSTPWAAPRIAAALARLSQSALRVRQWRIAAGAASFATRVAPRSTFGWVAATEALLSGVRPGPILDPILGIVSGPAGDERSAIRAGEQAVLADSTSAKAWYVLGKAERAAGNLDAAQRAWRQASQLDPFSADIPYALGRLEAARAERQGYFTDENRALHRALMLDALVSDPKHHHARYHLVRVAIRGADWATAMDAAATTGVPDALRSLSDAAPSRTDIAGWKSEASQAYPADLLLVIFWRLHELGAVSDAFDVKDAFAKRLLETTRPGGLHATAVRARSLACLGRTEEALGEIRSMRRRRPGGRDRAVLDKLASDLAYLAGDVGLHRRIPSRVRTEAERQFDSMIRGRSVIIIGPLANATNVPLDDFDVVIRTKSLGSNEPEKRTDIAYFANTGARLLRDRLGEALGRGHLRMAVLRPTMLDVASADDIDINGVRIAACENAALLEASQYGIPRVVYDVLRYSPARVRVVNADFFANGRAYDDSYHIDRGLGLREPVTGYGHDLRADHMTAASLMHNGVIEVDEHLAQILDQPTPDYLTRLSS